MQMAMAAKSLSKLSCPSRLIPVTEINARANPSVASLFFSTRHSPKLLTDPWLGPNLPMKSSVPSLTRLCRHRTIVATVVSSLPTTKPEGLESAEKLPKWSWRAVKSFVMAELEARKLKCPTTGTEALLMGILIEGTSFTSKYLRAHGITFYRVREETMKLLGKADMLFFSPEHPPLTEDAQRAIDWAVSHKQKSGDSGEITTTHMLLGIWSQVESPGYKIMTTLGFNDDKAKELESFISKPGFVDE